MEYETRGTDVNANLAALHDYEVPCAVCKRISPHDRGLMLPGSRICPRGFTRDYYGFLFAPHTTHQRGEHICIDAFAEGDGSPANSNGYLIYPVESYGVAGYVTYRTLDCAVCRSAAHGSIFTRWGKKTCPSGTNTIYSHVMAGPHYTQTGGGANQLCMAPVPTYLNLNTADRSGVRNRKISLAC